MWSRPANQYIRERVAVAEKRSSLPREAMAVMLLGIAAFFLVSLLSFNVADPTFNHAGAADKARNLAGSAGAQVADVLYQAVGHGAWWIPGLLIFMGLRLLYGKPVSFYWDRVLALPMVVAATSILCANLMGAEGWLNLPAGTGGMVGKVGARALTPVIGVYGSAVLVSALLLLGIMVLTRFSVLLVLGYVEGVALTVAAMVMEAGRWTTGTATRLQGLYQRREERDRLEEQLPDHAREPVVVVMRPEPVLGDVMAPTRSPPATPAPRVAKVDAELVIPSLLDDDAPLLLDKAAPKAPPIVVRKPPPPKQEPLPFANEELTALGEETPLPSLDLLEDAPQTQFGPDRDSLEMKARILEKKLADFKVEGRIVEVRPGPVVTTFELDPAPGLKASKVIGLSDDLARSISTVSVRVVGNIPGKSVIGIEIPNERRNTVYLRAILESEAMANMEAPLAVALGSDIHGHPVVADLAKMPHLLVAGTTGSGKSVAVNAMICSILFRCPPERVRLLMVDPKMLELSVYEGIPHLLAPVVTDVRKAANLLKWAVGEMERRYQLMSEVGVRNMAGFNAKVVEWKKQGQSPTRKVKTGFDPDTGQLVFEEQPIPMEHMPIILIVIDELADLMMTVGKEVEPAIGRLAQMARAAGLHLILATQRPSVDVITGLIKANFPTRLAFQVASRIDSRTILDSQGAESLLGMGDGLYQPPGTGTLRRVHAPYVSDEEVHRLVEYLKRVGKPVYNAAILAGAEAEGGDEEGGPGSDEDGATDGYDELYDQAASIVIKARKVSTSMVQRHFKIGYNRAARLVDKMEQEGLISQANSAGKREVLVPNRDAV